MSATLHHIASAALPVAIGLLVCAAIARAVLWTGFGDDQAERTARQHLEPLTVWCLGALALYVFTRSAAGGSWLGSFVVGGVLAAVATGLWLAGEEEPPAPAPADEPTPAQPAADGSLWADDGAPGRGLWSRG